MRHPHYLRFANFLKKFLRKNFVSSQKRTTFAPAFEIKDSVSWC